MMRAIALIVLVVFSTAAVAQEPTPSENALLSEYFGEEGFLAIGLGAVVSTSPYDGGDDGVLPVPVIYFRKGNFIAQTNQLRYDVYRGSGLSVGPIVKLRSESMDADDSSALAGMSDRDSTVDGGLAVTYVNVDVGVFSGSFQTDLTGKHKGQEFRVEYMIPFLNAFGNENLIIAPVVGVSWRTKLLNDYYYSVRPGEAAPGRPAYKSGSDANVTASLRVAYRLNERWALGGFVTAEWLGSEIRESPVVDDDVKLSSFIGAAYRF